MSDFLDCISLQNCCFILWYMKKTKTKTTANSGLLFCKLSIYKLLGFKWKPLGIVYGSPLACWCLTIKAQGFSEEKTFFPNQKLFLSIFMYRPDSSVPRNSVSKFFKIQCRFHYWNLLHCRLLTSLTHIPCFRFQLLWKMSKKAVLTLQGSLNPVLRKYFDLMNAMYLVMG